MGAGTLILKRAFEHWGFSIFHAICLRWPGERSGSGLVGRRGSRRMPGCLVKTLRAATHRLGWSLTQSTYVHNRLWAAVYSAGKQGGRTVRCPIESWGACSGWAGGPRHDLRPWLAGQASDAQLHLLSCAFSTDFAGGAWPGAVRLSERGGVVHACHAPAPKASRVLRAVFK